MGIIIIKESTIAVTSYVCRRGILKTNSLFIRLLKVAKDTV